MSASRIAPYCRSVPAAEPLRRLSEAPSRTALLFDVDGVLAPIVPRPEDARVPDDARAELRRLAGVYALVACVSGRASADARRIVGVDGIRYAGTHGLELEPAAERWREPLHRFVETVDWPAEDKGLSVSFHYRRAGDEAAARGALEAVAERARRAGLVARFGRKVLELVPPVEADKGTAVQRLLSDAAAARGLYAGDDTTDLDAFRGLRSAGLELTLCVAVSSPEGPAELREAADLVLPGSEDVLELLRRL
jgi:trehalose 6-phosphate phosphatase